MWFVCFVSVRWNVKRLWMDPRSHHLDTLTHMCKIKDKMVVFFRGMGELWQIRLLKGNRWRCFVFLQSGNISCLFVLFASQEILRCTQVLELRLWKNLTKKKPVKEGNGPDRLTRLPVDSLCLVKRNIFVLNVWFVNHGSGLCVVAVVCTV